MDEELAVLIGQRNEVMANIKLLKEKIDKTIRLQEWDTEKFRQYTNDFERLQSEGTLLFGKINKILAEKLDELGKTRR